MQEKIEFKKLTPNNAVDLKTYEQAIDFAFNNDDVNNIAISGAYGSGKSSIIETYKKSHSGNKYITISLAHFNDDNRNNKKESTGNPAIVKKAGEDAKANIITCNNSNIETTLERKIINQLIHKVPYEKIPHTGFKLKSNINNKNIILTTIGIIALLVSLCHLLLFDKWAEYVKHFKVPIIKCIFNITIYQWFPTITAVICLVIISIGIHFIVKAQYNRNIFKSLKFKDAEIELYEDDNTESYFDKYLNDILYIFENCDENVFIFEDLDRFDSVLIFERLREINNLVNFKVEQTNIEIEKLNEKKLKHPKINHFRKLKSCKKHIKFFYLLRDDIFISKERTKFFDFLIPIVPVVDGSNSYEKVLKFFKDDVDNNELETQFLSDLSLYVDDMRLLENIYNEFEIYKNQLNDTKRNYNKLLALIVYKNIFPKDFADLQLGRSFINAIFKTKTQLVKASIEKIDLEISAKKDYLSLVKNEVAKDLRELNLIFDNDSSRYDSRYLYNRSLTVEAKKEKTSREKIIKDRLANPDLEKLIEEEIKKLEKDKELLKSSHIKELLNNETGKIAFSAIYKNFLNEKNEYKEVKRNEYFGLLKYLVRYGYIDEYYSDYITYFYPESISLQDKNFVISVIEHKPLEFNYELNNPKTIVDRIRIIDFKENEVLNYQLVTYLLNTKKYSEQLECVLLQIKDNKNIEFIYGYLQEGSEPILFVKELNIIWPEVFNGEILKYDDSHIIKQYSLLTLYSFEETNIAKINISNCLTDYISNCKHFLDINNPKECLIKRLKSIGVKFTSFDADVCNQTLLTSAYKNDLYVINKENIFMIYNNFFDINDEEVIKHKNYEILLSNSESAFYQYISSNINEYLECVLGFCEGVISDNEETAVLVLNNDNISFESKQRYINCLDKQIVDLSSVSNKDIQEELVNNSKAGYSESNIVEYVRDADELNKSQINFINSSDTELDFGKLKLSDEEKSNLFTLFVCCNELRNSKYVNILVSLHRVYKNGFSIEQLTSDKINILIENKIIYMSKNGIDNIRENYPDSIMFYIKTNINEYIDLIDSSNFSFDEMLEILEWDIDFAIKEKLLTLNQNEIHICNHSYSDKVNAFILNSNMYADDKEVLFEKFSGFGVDSRKQIYSIANNNLKIVLDMSNASLLLIKLLIDNNLDDNGLEMLLTNFNRFSKEQVIDYLVKLGNYKYSEILDSTKRPRFEVNNLNKRILQHLVDAKYIHDFTENNGYYSIQRKSHRKTKLFSNAK